MASLATVVLGAGFSHTAGLPLARRLFDVEVLATSRSAAQRFDQVLAAWQTWESEHPEGGPEQFLTEVYLSPGVGPVSWSWAQEYVAAVLATPLPGDRGSYNLRYAGRITRPLNISLHDKFWTLILAKFDLHAVVTTNYDILIERGLRHQPMKRPPRPGIHYGGIPRPQVLKGTSLPFSVQKYERYIELTGTIPLYKLHGSLNWGKEYGEFAFYQDLRPAFRRGGDTGIVPPVEEKEAPNWLLNVWRDAQAMLAATPQWFICGYSLPSYDEAIGRLFLNAATHGGGRRIMIADPFAHQIADRWRTVAPHAEIMLFPGLPDALPAIEALPT